MNHHGKICFNSNLLNNISIIFKQIDGVENHADIKKFPRDLSLIKIHIIRIVNALNISEQMCYINIGGDTNLVV